MPSQCPLARREFWDSVRARDSIPRELYPSVHEQSATFPEDSARLRLFHSFEWRHAAPAALRHDSGKCTASKGERLARNLFPETRKLLAAIPTKVGNQRMV